MDQALQSYLSRIVPGIAAKSALAVIELAGEGGTVPFIARYRKEKTGNLDEVQIRAVLDGFETYNEIVKRKAFLVKEIGEQNNLTAEIKKRIAVSGLYHAEQQERHEKFAANLIARQDYRDMVGQEVSYPVAELLPLEEPLSSLPEAVVSNVVEV